MKIINSSKKFGLLIKDTRKKNHITQRELAAASGTGIRFIQDLEKGKSTCELDKALTVASMLGIELQARLKMDNIQENP